MREKEEMLTALIQLPYSGYFSGGVKFSWFSWLGNTPRNIYPRNINSYKATPINSRTYVQYT